MRAILLLWTVPLVFFWTWFALSANDISFGTIFFSRQLHDLMMQIYGNMIGVDPSSVPMLLAWACIVDTGIILAIAAFRWRGKWFPVLRDGIYRLRGNPAGEGGVVVTPASKADPALPAE
jgi:hypothetical protein